jgi:hypothetical protein
MRMDIKARDLGTPPRIIRVKYRGAEMQYLFELKCDYDEKRNKVGSRDPQKGVVVYCGPVGDLMSSIDWKNGGV